MLKYSSFNVICNTSIKDSVIVISNNVSEIGIGHRKILTCKIQLVKK